MNKHSQPRSCLLLAFLTLLVFESARASNCPPIGPLLSGGGTNRLVAEVYVAATIPSPGKGFGVAVVADVVRVFNGIRVPDRIVIESGFSPAFGGCGQRFHEEMVGSRFIVNASVNLYTGHYGGGWLDYALPVVDGRIKGAISNVYTSSETMTVATFSDLASSMFSAPDYGSLEVLGLATDPAIVTEGEPFNLQFIGYHLYDPFSVEVDVEQGLIDVYVAGVACFSAGNPPLPPNNSPEIVTVPLEGLPPGTYTVHAAQWGDCQGGAAAITDEIQVFPASTSLVYSHDSPKAGETVSGVGLVFGWACNAGSTLPINSVSYSIDNHEFRSPLPHGSLRQDTGHICKQNFNELDPVNSGYGGLIYWGWYEEGAHTFTVYINGKEVESFEFYVARPSPDALLDESRFRKGASGEYVIENFLGTDETVTIRWSESNQNFVIVDYN